MLSRDLFEVWRHGKQQLSRRRLLALMGVGGAAVTATTLSGCSLGPLDLGGNSNAAAGGGTATTSQGMQVPAQTPAQKAAPTQSSTRGSNVLAQVAQVPVNSARTFPLPDQSNPGVLIHLPDQRFVAFNSTCTHQQCAVAYNSQNHMLECPCHGSIFNPAQNGAVVQGPATAPLAAIKIVVNMNGAITMA